MLRAQVVGEARLAGGGGHAPPAAAAGGAAHWVGAAAPPRTGRGMGGSVKALPLTVQWATGVRAGILKMGDAQILPEGYGQRDLAGPFWRERGWWGPREGGKGQGGLL